VTSRIFARTAIVAASLVVAILGALHALSPEFDPAWRVVSEYANGRYGWVLSLMFACWALGSWALALAMRPYMTTAAGRIGLAFLVVSGAGEALAAAFDINQPLHGLAGLLGVGGLPIAAILISITLRRTQSSLRGTSALLWSANATWLVVVALIASLAVQFLTFMHAGGHVPSDGQSLPLGTVLPAGVIAVVGYANRLLVLVYCGWMMLAAWNALACSDTSRSRSRWQQSAAGLRGHLLRQIRAFAPSSARTIASPTTVRGRSGGLGA